MNSTIDSNGKRVEVGNSILIKGIDPRLTELLPEDEVAEIKSIIGLTLKVQTINSDGSMVVTKETQYSDGVVAGFDIAIFPEGAELNET